MRNQHLAVCGDALLDRIETRIIGQHKPSRSIFQLHSDVFPNFHRMPAEMADLTIQDVYASLVNDPARNALIAADLRSIVETGRSPLLLTGRKEHLEFFAAAVEGCAKHVFVLKGGMGKRQRRMTAEALAAVAETESRVIRLRARERWGTSA